jgi:hypothetical protein
MNIETLSVNDCYLGSNLHFIQFRNSLLQNWVSQRFKVLRNNRVILGCSKTTTMKHSFQDIAMTAFRLTAACQLSLISIFRRKTLNIFLLKNDQLDSLQKQKNF